MTIWIIFYFYLFKHRPNLRQRRIVTESLSLGAGDSVQKKVYSIVRFALTVQLIGAILLGFVFLPEYGVGKGIYYSVFHSISACCNAGFDLIGNSLIDYQTHPYLLLIIASLIMRSEEHTSELQSRFDLVCRL